MSSSSQTYPFTAFNFSVEILQGSNLVCDAAFAECDGLEVSMDIKTIREGGNNDQQVRLAGPHTFGTLSLKRGMTSASDLWAWVAASVANPSLRLDARVVLHGSTPNGSALARFELSRCLPQKMKAPSLNAKDGMVAIEELQMAYESLKFFPGGS
ncbi:MAG TPA: phage tail protein [Polyangiaceae bacterium]|nr:phage tail protein [Polyangiaceae bacterium]